MTRRAFPTRRTGPHSSPCTTCTRNREKSSEELLGIRRRDKIRNGVAYAVSFFLFNGAFFFLTWFMGLFDALGDGEWSFTTHLRMWIISALYIAALFGSAKLVMKLGLVRDADEAEDWEK